MGQYLPGAQRHQSFTQVSISIAQPNRALTATARTNFFDSPYKLILHLNSYDSMGMNVCVKYRPKTAAIFALEILQIKSMNIIFAL